MGGLVVAGFGVGAIATAEALGWEPTVLDVADRLSGTFGSPAYLGAATALLLPIAIGVAAPTTSTSSRVRVVGAVGGGGAPGCRVPRLGGAGGVAGARGRRRSWSLRPHAGAVQALVRRRPGRSAAIAVGLASVAVVVLVATPVGSRLGDATDPDRAGGRGRIDEWRVAANVVADHPVVGVGPEGYRTAFHEGVDERYERAHGRRQQPDRAHSAPLDLALIGGLPLLAVWVAVLALVGRAAWRLLRDGAPWERGLAAGARRPLGGPAAAVPRRRARARRLAPGGFGGRRVHRRTPLVLARNTRTQGSVVPGQNAWGRGWVGRGLGVLVVGALWRE